MPRLYLPLEFLLLFVALPISLRYAPWRIPPLPVLWAATAFCLSILLRDPTFDRSQLWNPAPLPGELANILLLFGLSAAALAVGTCLFARPMLFAFVRASPGFWALVMLLYPVLSVYPQGLIYRAFLMHRYQPLFQAHASSPLLIILASAAAFSLMHLIFRNPLAIVLTFLGGLLFAYRYQQTGSLFVSSFEHALYGCFLFTIGLGRYFYARSL
jgi:membrane protease YdiL (CAAX protease family)